ncbi:MAG: cysteine desulfurase family protein [Myxococcota bacterium]|nr:cysteine desulfurase family protein [Myxococcota bacterium]
MAVYLDHNASAPMSREVAEELRALLLEMHGNPSSVHQSGRKARARIEGVRRRLAKELGGQPNEITFTSGATEATTLVLSSLVEPGDHVVCSAFENPAIHGALAALNARVTYIRGDAMGRLNPADFQAAVDETTALVIVMMAQNEIGNIFPVKDIVTSVKPVPVFCDAVQALGRIEFDVEELGIKAASVSAHKIGGPTGVGALWLKAGTELKPTIHGGPQERGRRAGTENVVGIAGFGTALKHLAARRADSKRQLGLKKTLIAGLLKTIDGVHVHGDLEKCLANTLSFRIEGVSGELLLQALDLAGFQISSGSACSSGGLEPSETLLALGLTQEQARSGLRVSLGMETTNNDIDEFLSTLPGLIARIRASSKA